VPSSHSPVGSAALFEVNRYLVPGHAQNRTFRLAFPKLRKISRGFFPTGRLRLMNHSRRVLVHVRATELAIQRHHASWVLSRTAVQRTFHCCGRRSLFPAFRLADLNAMTPRRSRSDDTTTGPG